MKANLFINYYVDKHPKRNNELERCLIENINNKEIDRLIIILSESDKDSLKELTKRATEKNKVFIILKEDRPPYNYYFNLTHKYPDDINMIANTDIVMDDRDLKRLKEWNWRRYCLCLSRWDYLDDRMDKRMSKHYAHRDSQDTWIVKGRFPNIPKADFCLGKKGCDNRIAHELSRFFDVINPSQTIRTFHYHVTNIKNYAPHGVNKDLVSPPYKLIEPNKLPL